MRARQAAAGVDAMVAGKSAPDDPEQRKQRQRQAEPKSGTLERRRPLEIIEVDALCEVLGCSCSRHGAVVSFLRLGLS